MLTNETIDDKKCAWYLLARQFPWCECIDKTIYIQMIFCISYINCNGCMGSTKATTTSIINILITLAGDGEFFKTEEFIAIQDIFKIIGEARD